MFSLSTTWRVISAPQPRVCLASKQDDLGMLLGILFLLFGPSKLQIAPLPTHERQTVQLSLMKASRMQGTGQDLITLCRAGPTWALGQMAKLCDPVMSS